MRVALVTSILACALLVPGKTDAAGAVLPPTNKVGPSFVDVRMAVAVSPTGSTRWSEITIPADKAVMWLVPVRPGAAIDWASPRWLDVLDEATAPQVLPPRSATTCPWRRTPEMPASWTTSEPHKMPVSALAVQTTADGARAWVAERGYRLEPSIDGRISALYASGWNLVAVEMTSSWFQRSSATLRVSDDGGAVLPLVLTGDSSTRLTVFAIGGGVAAVPGAREVDPSALRWGKDGSSFVTWRRDVIRGDNGKTWLRESSSHAALFDGTPVTDGSSIRSVVVGWFQGTSCTPEAAQSSGSHAGVVGTACAPGAAAQVPGGLACVPASGELAPATFSCAGDIDLSLALSGLVPTSAVVTRLAGWIPAGELGTNLGVAFDAAGMHQPPVIHAGAHETCPQTPSSSPAPDPASPRPPLSSTSASSGGGDVYVPTSDGCGGGPVATGTTYEEEPAPDDTSTESCSGDGSSSGWDDSDDGDGWDDSDSGDSCSTDDSSSSSSDSCSGGSSSSSSGGSDDGWDSEDGDDGWDTEDSDDGWDSEDMSPQGKKLKPASKKPKPHAKTTKKKSSPVSRYALLAAALLLPLRRRRRDAEGR